MNTKFEIALERFYSGAQEKVSTRNTEKQTFMLSIERGKKYAKVMEQVWIHQNKGQSTLFCFIDMENGDVLKPASWKAPAKHARGNIYDEFNGVNGVDSYGAKYLR